MTEDELKRIARHYGEMSETELMLVARDYEHLQEDAQALLRSEFSRRSLEPPLVEDDEPTTPSYQDLVTVARYRDLSEAIVARSVLESEGIVCFLKDENTIRMDWAWSNLLGGLRLQVPQQDLAKAGELLSHPPPETIEFSEEPYFEQPICPKCGSSHVELGVGPAASKVIALFLFSVPIPSKSSPPGEEVWHCLTCGCKWLDDGEPEQPDA
ncbi:MAG: DUF2007 domain-containing protein [Acidobacteriaceae bacterium]